MTLIINIGGLALITAIAGWFWLWKSGAATRADSASAVDIIVANGIYKPDVIEVKRGEKIVLNFHREDASPCAEQVIFHGLDISETLPIGKTKAITLTPTTSGNYRFTCQMQMYQGVLKVIDA